MKISYNISVFDELFEIKRSIEHIKKYKNEEDEIVIVFDSKNGTEEVKSYLDSVSDIKVFDFKFNDNFAELKNYLKSKCTGDFTFNLDADEMIGQYLLENMHSLVDEYSSQGEIILIPRINFLVDDVVPEGDGYWNFAYNSPKDPTGNFPDYQGRLLKNTPEIKWIRKLHEIQTGGRVVHLPPEDRLSIIHIKTRKRHEDRGKYYSSGIFEDWESSI